MRKLIIISLLVTIFASCGKIEDIEKPMATKYTIDWNSAADSSTNALVSNFWVAQDKYFKSKNDDLRFEYWPQAHALDVITDAYIRTKDTKYKILMDEWLVGVKQKNGGSYINHFYDDMQWNAIATLRVYELTKDEKFKDAAMSMWTDIKSGWDDVLGGGIYWNKDKKEKNSCSNGPAAIVAIQMYNLFDNPADLEWAKKIYTWEKEILYENASGLIYDHMKVVSSEIVKTSYTYNQGTFVGAAVGLYNITHESMYLNDAMKAAEYAITNHVSAEGIMKGVTQVADDTGLFDGIFIRYFTQLTLNQSVREGGRTKYLRFLKRNAESLWYNGVDKSRVLYGIYWNEAPSWSSVGLKEQVSASTMVEAMNLIKRSGL